MNFINNGQFRISGIIFSLILAIASFAYGEEPTHLNTSDHKTGKSDLKSDNSAPANGSPIESLSPGLRELLSKEMLAVQQGMMSIIPAYAAGNWDEIEAIALQIKDSYILKQSLTPDQRRELHSALPSAFLKQDQAFHNVSGMLKHAASTENAELVGFYFSKLNESCISCHSQYAAHRFPALANNKNEHAH